MAAIFTLSNFSLDYGAESVLSNISLSIDVGEKVALLGPSGAGKSSLLTHLYQLQPTGSAWLPQDLGLVELLSVYHNIFMGGLERYSTLAALWNLIRPLPAALAEIKLLAAQLGLSERLNYSVDQLSGGQQQRVALGRALYRRQPIFLGDEPVSALDPHQAEALLLHVLAAHQTVIISLHNWQLAFAHFDRVIVLRAGQVKFDGAPGALNAAQREQLYQQVFAGADDDPGSPPGTPADGQGPDQSWVIRTS